MTFLNVSGLNTADWGGDKKKNNNNMLVTCAKTCMDVKTGQESRSRSPTLKGKQYLFTPLYALSLS